MVFNTAESTASGLLKSKLALSIAPYAVWRLRLVISIAGACAVYGCALAFDVNAAYIGVAIASYVESGCMPSKTSIVLKMLTVA